MDTPRSDRTRASSLFAAALAFAAAALLALQQHLLDVATFAQRGADTHGAGGRILGPDFYLTLPYPVLDMAFSPSTSIHLALIALGAVETLVLYALYRLLRERGWGTAERVAIALAAAVMLLIALDARTLIGFDLYAYLGYAKLPSVAAAYAPPPGRFPGALGVVNDAWGAPLVASYYGPLWIGLARLIAGGASSIGAAIFALRLFEVLPFAAIAALLAIRGGTPAVALFVLNAPVYQLYLANGHNDLVGTAFVLGAVTLAVRVPAAAAVLVAAAGLIKLPFAAAALLVFAGRGALARRIGWAVLAAALVVAGSLLFAGTAYVHDLTFRLHEVNAQHGLINELTGKTIKIGLVLVAALALGAAFLRGVVWRNASWSFAALSSMVYPWYFAWSLPYAFLERGALVRFLVLFPLAAAMLENAFPHLGTGQLAMLVMMLAAAYEIVRRKMNPIDAQIERPGP